MKIEPCPWCGTTDKRKIIGRGSFGRLFRIEHFCRFASILGREFFKTENEAIEAWNGRKDHA